MVTTINEGAMLAERRRSALQRIRRQYPQFVAERDHAGEGYIVRNRLVPGRVTIVTAGGECSCTRYRLFDLCRHVAAVAAGEEGSHTHV